MSDQEIARFHASYVLDWLRRADAPENIIGLQECVVIALGGYASPDERRGAS